MAYLIQLIANPIFKFALTLNALLYIFQLFQLLRTKNAENISLLMFLYFFAFLLIQAWQAFYLHDHTYMVGMIFCVTTNSLCLITLIYYRLKNKKQAPARGAFS